MSKLLFLLEDTYLVSCSYLDGPSLIHAAKAFKSWEEIIKEDAKLNDRYTDACKFHKRKWLCLGLLIKFSILFVMYYFTVASLISTLSKYMSCIIMFISLALT